MDRLARVFVRPFIVGTICWVICASSLLAQDRPGRGQDVQSPGVESGGAGEVSEDIHAQLVPKRFTTLSSDAAGQIERMTVREGDRFKQGQMLISLDCSLQRAQLAEARAILAGAQKASAVNRRMVELHSGGVLEADLAAAEAAKDAARVQSAEVLQAKCTIFAPYQGRVVEQKVREHQFVQPGQAMLDILDDSALEVEFIAPSRWLAWITQGMEFRVRIDETGLTYPARVTTISAKADAVSHSIKIIGELTGSQSNLIAGMSGRVLMAPPR